VRALGRSFSALWESALRALRPEQTPLAVVPAVRAVAAAGLVAVAGAATHDLDTVAIAYFGASCAVVFITTPVYRTRVVMLVAQAGGAVCGITLGVVLPHQPGAVVLVATLAGFVSGALGALGPAWTAAALMLLVGLSFGQFAGLDLPWWQQALWFVIGTAVVAVPAVSLWPWNRDRVERAVIAAVFESSADLLASVGSSSSAERRHALALASARARTMLPSRRVARDGHRAARWRQDTAALRAAEQAALAAAALHASSVKTGDAVPMTIRRVADDVRRGRRVGRQDELRGPAGSVPTVLQPLADALALVTMTPSSSAVAPPPRVWRELTSSIAMSWRPDARRNAVRLALCMGIATACVVILREPSHSYWLPLTVAVVVRPEYSSVFVRTLNRVVGTVVGAALAAILLLLTPDPWAIAGGAAMAIGFAALTGQKLYALGVVGITASALLSASIGSADPVFPLYRVFDTLIGALIAIVFGYLLWPGRARTPAADEIRSAAAAARRYIDSALAEGSTSDVVSARQTAFRLAHEARASADAAVLEPPPVGALAVALQTAARSVEDVVDEISATMVLGSTDVLRTSADRLRARIETAVAATDPVGAVVLPNSERRHRGRRRSTPS
jgi:uncharacterized membrane protein YccC